MSVSLPSVCVPCIWFNGRSARHINVDFPDRDVCRYRRSAQSIFCDISIFSTCNTNCKSFGIIAQLSFHLGAARSSFNQSKYQLFDGWNYFSTQYSRFEANWCCSRGLALSEFRQQSYAALRRTTLLDLHLGTDKNMLCVRGSRGIVK